MRLALLQNILAPYRIPLFAGLAQSPGVEFQLFLSARSERRRSWEIDFDNLPFRCEFVPNVTVRAGYEREVQFSYGLPGALARFRPDVIVCGGFSLQTLLSLIYKARAGARLYVWSEGHNRSRRAIRRWITRQADGYLASGAFARDGLLRLGAPPKLIYTVYNCVDVPGLSAQAGRHRRQLPPRRRAEPAVLYVGQLVERKGVWDLVRAFEQVQQQIPEARLVMVGDGPLAQNLADYCQSKSLRAALPGFVQERGLAAYYAEARVFALATHGDIGPFVLLEALACGLPVVVSDAAGHVPDAIEDGRNGFIFPAGDHTALAARLIQVLSDEALQARLAAAASASSQKFTVESTTRAFLQALGPPVP